MGLNAVEAAFNAVDNVSEVVGNIARNVGETLGGMTSGADNEMGLFGSILSGAAELGFGAIVSAGAMAVTQTFEMEESMAGVAARTGATGQALEKFKSQAENLFSTGLVKSFDDAARAMEATSHVYQNMDDPKVKEFATDAAGVGKAWNESASDVINAVKQIDNIFPELKKDPITTLNLLTDIAQKTGKPLGDIEGIIERYGPKFAAAGLGAMAMGGMLVLAAQAGVSDKGMGGLASAVDTFQSKIMNPDAKFTEGMRVLGLGDLPKMVETNKIPVETAMNAVFQAFGKPIAGATLATVATELFGTSIDQVGGPDKLAKLSGFATVLGGPDGVAGKAKVAASAVEDTLGGAIDRTWDNIKSGIGTAGDTIYHSLKNADWSGAMNTVEKAITGAWDTISTTVSKTASDLWAGIVQGINNLAKGIRDAYNEVVGAFQRIADGIAHAWQVVVDILQKIVDAINFILGHGGFTPGGGNGGSGGGTPSFHAIGGGMDEGWNILGEQGPELVWKAGQTANVLTNPQTKRALGNAGGGSGTSIVIAPQVGVLVGSDGMNQFTQMLYKKFQEEDLRRGKRT